MSSTNKFNHCLNHPIALEYFKLHPRRQKIFFGPYLLLNTLGEGEFGKVKLGIHSEFGEQVAVKLIRRNSVSDKSRLSKVEREIFVLRSVNHPHIVGLYDVIETEKYIGIVLEYAPGGELFDFILRHKYLKERDACRLFAQLISGVCYLHDKKVIHRDLKLENLLLDRGRNIIITDFGFANRFEHRVDDLMATSCGSPCYAAPELVISDGLYVGSAVDIWSCGVILYAMLAGYLPFDDDPQNPEGDNINLLYKYIVSTPLTFPDFVSPQARHLLSMMLVPDPTKRCSIHDIMAHPWLKSYSHLFDRSVDQWEQLSQDLLNAKRMAQKRQLQAFELEALTPSIIRSQTEADPNLFPAISSKNARHQSAMGIPTSASSTLSPVDYLQRANQDAANEYLEYQQHLYDNSSGRKRDAPDTITQSTNNGKRNVQRHTIQVEYENQQDDHLESSKSTQFDTKLLSPDDQLPVTPPNNQIPTPSLNAAEEAQSPLATQVTQGNQNAKAQLGEPANINTVPLPSSQSTNQLASADAVDSSNKKVKRETAPAISTDQSTDKVSEGNTTKHSKPPISSGALKMMNKNNSNNNDDENKSTLSSNRSSGGNVSSNSKESNSKKTSPTSQSGRRKALSLMVEPFGKSSASKDRNKAMNQSNKINDENKDIQQQQQKRERKSSAAFLSSNKTSNQISSTSPPSGTFTNVAGTTFDGSNQVNSHKGSSSRAKSVMNWFRNKGLSKAGGEGIQTMPTSTTTTKTTTTVTQSSDENKHNIPPTASIKTRPSTAGAGAGAVNTQYKPVSDEAMDTHMGTVDQNALTALPPSVAMAEVRRVITKDLGLLVKKEGQVNLKCVRPSKKQKQQSQNQQPPLLNSSSSGGGLRSLLMFKRSSSQSTNLSSSAGVTSSAEEDTLNPVYGEAHVDSAGEVVLDVKLTKIKNLPGWVVVFLAVTQSDNIVYSLYSVDLKRISGNLRDYRYLYLQVFE
ncbi:hypothetical protein E3P99_01634 [Wallemia hederae]|uniref:Protein kinase domain-containing protein n=1 Tax=Wallemia hederae TaxID=1540922 RepID=A0A4V4LTH2_9BASI|nr:hypothetical protein E3P99_01634 [Wallemia hederae]